MIYVATGEVVSGKLKIDERERMLDELAQWSDGPVDVTIEKLLATRSPQANRYYWGAVIKAIARHTGYTADETHDMLKIMFLPKELAVANYNGEIVSEFVIGGSTRRLNSVDFYDYVERVRLWALETLELNILPPDPDWRAHVETERAKLARADPQ
jgi:hypothetical protein